MSMSLAKTPVRCYASRLVFSGIARSMLQGKTHKDVAEVCRTEELADRTSHEDKLLLSAR